MIGIKILDDFLDVGPENLDESELDCLQVSPAVFKQDFGPWKKDQVVHCLAINLVKGTMQVYDANNNIEVECVVALTIRP